MFDASQAVHIYTPAVNQQIRSKTAGFSPQIFRSLPLSNRRAVLSHSRRALSNVLSGMAKAWQKHGKIHYEKNEE